MPLDTALVEALGRLTPTDRALLELSLRRGIPDGEIANLLGLASSQVGESRERALDRLAAGMHPDTRVGADELQAALRGQDAGPWIDHKGEDGPQSTSASRSGPPPGRLGRLARATPGVALLLLPGALTAYFGFSAGGFFPDATAAATVVICLALLLRVTLAERPLAGTGALGLSATAALGALSGWILLSRSWSQAPGRALLEFDRALLYVLTLALFASLPRSARALQVMIWGFAGAASVVCLAGLGSRVLPDLVSAAPSVSSERLAYPVTYWNALGMLAALGVVACFHMAAAEREPRLARVLGAAAVPALAVTLFFTFSRGAIAVLAVALFLYAVLGRPRGLASAVLATVPASLVAIAVAYGADKLATENPTAASAAGQANRVALVTALAIAAAAALRALLIRLDMRLSALRLPSRMRHRVVAGSVAFLLLATSAAVLALDAPTKLERQYDRFVEGRDVEAQGDARRRLTDPANNGRLDQWRVALDVYRDDRLKGQGAGTYEISWARERPVTFLVVDAHSLYLETLAELGVVGLVLLAAALLLLLAGAAWRIRGPDRAVYAAIFAMALAWLIRAGADWDWEMPVISVWLFALGGAALARRQATRSRLDSPPRVARVFIGLVVLALALTPALIYVSQTHLDRSSRSFQRGDCRRAVDQALAATSALSIRPEPFEILAYCDVKLGRAGLAVSAMEQAVERDPRAWQLRYGLALVRAAAGRDPRPAARSALSLNPRSPLARDAVKRFRTNDPRVWKRRALDARLPTG